MKLHFVFNAYKKLLEHFIGFRVLNLVVTCNIRPDDLYDICFCFY